MKIFAFVLLSLLSSFPVRAEAAEAAPSEKTFKFERGTRSFLYFSGRHLLISAACRDPGTGKLDCKALRAFERSSLAGVVLPRGGADPGAVICVKRLEGRVVIGQNERGAQAAFCRLADDTLVSTGSLDYAANH
jgi:hypothetical protein